AIEDHLRVVVLDIALLGQDAVPVLLHIVENERDKLHLASFFLVKLGVARAVVRSYRSRSGAAEDLEQVLVEYQTEHTENDGPSDTDMHTAEAASAKTEAASASAVIAPVFDIGTCSARSPFHCRFLRAI